MSIAGPREYLLAVAGRGERPTCSFRVLGPLVFERDGEPVAVPGGHQRFLLALLLMAGGVPLSRDRLIDELWGERPPASAISALHVHLSRLRTLLGELLVFDTAGYALRTGELELDVWRLDELIEQARSERARARELLAEALTLFRGEPLCDVPAEGGVARWRRALEQKQLEATLMRIDADLDSGASRRLIAEVELLAGEHPLEEKLQGQLMLALYRAGRQADALDVYQRFRRMLASELGLEPGQQLTRLQARMLDGDPSLLRAESPESSGPVAATRARPVSMLPRPATRLVGREFELTELAALTADQDIRLITLVGPGGVGKTRLAIEHARGQERVYADGAVFVGLERLTDPNQVRAEIAGTLQRANNSDEPSADALGRYLRARAILLVIDNFEHLLDAASIVAELLGEATGVRILVTSRAPLHLRGERVFEVQPLGLPAGETIEQFAASPAVQLYVDGATAANPALSIDAAAITTIATICRALDGLPLAIELAAARSRLLGPDQIAAQLTEPLTVGRHALRDLPDRQQTLHAAIAWSDALLTPAARDVLRAAAVFLGGFTREAVGSVAGRPAEPELDELLEASLVQPAAIPGRCRLLGLVRAYALAQLDDLQAQELRARHGRFFAKHFAAASTAHEAGVPPAELAAPMFADHANLRTALMSACSIGDRDVAVAIALAMRPLWFARMMQAESEELVRTVLDRFTPEPRDELRLMQTVSFFEGFMPGGTWTQRYADRAGELGEDDLRGVAVSQLFVLAMNRRDMDALRAQTPALLALVRPGSSPRASGWAHYNLALGHYIAGRFDAASDHALQSAQSGADTGHAFMRASAVGLNLMARSAGDEMIALRSLTEAVELLRRPGIPPMTAWALWLTARYAAELAPDRARLWLAVAERIVEATGPLWPEDTLRDEALAVLGIDDLAPVIEATPEIDPDVALAEAAEWLAERDPAERIPRRGALAFLAVGS